MHPSIPEQAKLETEQHLREARGITMKKTDKELADEIDARKRLKERGYRRKPCRCLLYLPYATESCPLCHGKGYTWEAPLT